MSKPFPVAPKHPERICWGCDRYCRAEALACGNGSGRVMHPSETLGEDWYLAWGLELDPDHPNRVNMHSSNANGVRTN